MESRAIGNFGTIFMFLAKEQVLGSKATQAMYLGLIKHLVNECPMFFDRSLWARC